MPFPSFVEDLPLTRRALGFAAARHGDQQRDVDHAPFILHPLEVTHLLHGHGCHDHIVAAGVLHDTVEDAQVTREELETNFGEEVAALVCAVTEPEPVGTYRKRKAALRTTVEAAEDDALAIYAADKVVKVRELRMAIAVRHDTGGAEKLEHYEASLALLERRLPGHPLVRQLRFELEALSSFRPARVEATRGQDLVERPAEQDRAHAGNRLEPAGSVGQGVVRRYRERHVALRRDQRGSGGASQSRRLGLAISATPSQPWRRFPSSSASTAFATARVASRCARRRSASSGIGCRAHAHATDSTASAVLPAERASWASRARSGPVRRLDSITASSSRTSRPHPARRSPISSSAGTPRFSTASSWPAQPASSAAHARNDAETPAGSRASPTGSLTKRAYGRHGPRSSRDNRPFTWRLPTGASMTPSTTKEAR